MSLSFYCENEDYVKEEESIDKYKDLFYDYQIKFPTLSEALEQMFINNGALPDKAKKLVDNIISKCEVVLKNNGKRIKEEYPELTEEEIKIISSYTCECDEKKYNPYKLLNTNMVANDRKQGIKNVSKYLYILLKTLRKLKKYESHSKSDYLYRGIRTLVKLNYDLYNKELVPYIKGNKKIFWAFTSTSPDFKTSISFLDEQEFKEKTIKTGTIFTIYGKIIGYDITLFNFYPKEKEVLLEPERKFIIDEIKPELNGIINIRCELLDSPIVLENLYIEKKNYICPLYYNNFVKYEVNDGLFQEMNENYMDYKENYEKNYCKKKESFSDRPEYNSELEQLYTYLYEFSKYLDILSHFKKDKNLTIEQIRYEEKFRFLYENRFYTVYYNFLEKFELSLKKNYGYKTKLFYDIINISSSIIQQLENEYASVIYREMKNNDHFKQAYLCCVKVFETVKNSEAYKICEFFYYFYCVFYENTHYIDNFIEINIDPKNNYENFIRKYRFDTKELMDFSQVFKKIQKMKSHDIMKFKNIIQHIRSIGLIYSKHFESKGNFCQYFYLDKSGDYFFLSELFIMNIFDFARNCCVPEVTEVNELHDEVEDYY